MSLALRKATQVVKTESPRRFVFLLLDKFTMINFDERDLSRRLPAQPEYR